jgi:hypothetical protein
MLHHASAGLEAALEALLGNEDADETLSLHQIHLEADPRQSSSSTRAHRLASQQRTPSWPTCVPLARDGGGKVATAGSGTGAAVVPCAGGNLTLPPSTFRRLLDPKTPTLVASADLVDAGCSLWLSAAGSRLYMPEAPVVVPTASVLQSVDLVFCSGPGTRVPARGGCRLSGSARRRAHPKERPGPTLTKNDFGDCFGLMRERDEVRERGTKRSCGQRPGGPQVD